MLLRLLNRNLLLCLSLRRLLRMLSQDDLLAWTWHTVDNLQYLLMLLLLLLLKLLGSRLHRVQRCCLRLFMDQIRLNHLRTVVLHFGVVNVLRLSRLPKRIREGTVLLLNQVVRFMLLLLRLLLLGRLSLRLWRLINNLLQLLVIIVQ